MQVDGKVVEAKSVWYLADIVISPNVRNSVVEAEGDLTDSFPRAGIRCIGYPPNPV